MFLEFATKIGVLFAFMPCAYNMFKDIFIWAIIFFASSFPRSKGITLQQSCGLICPSKSHIVNEK